MLTEFEEKQTIIEAGISNLHEGLHSAVSDVDRVSRWMRFANLRIIFLPSLVHGSDLRMLDPANLC